jgi:hypothetical protein
MEKKVNVTLYCPRCQGRVFRYNDQDGWYEQCIRCGFLRYLDAVPAKAAVGRKNNS